MGIRLLWLGVFFRFAGEIALLTSPAGVNIFVIKGASGLPFRGFVVGLLLYVDFLISGLVIIYYLP